MFLERKVPGPYVALGEYPTMSLDAARAEKQRRKDDANVAAFISRGTRYTQTVDPSPVETPSPYEPLKTAPETEAPQPEPTYDDREAVNFQPEDIAFNEACRKNDHATPIERINALYTAIILTNLPAPGTAERFTAPKWVCDVTGLDQSWVERKLKEYLTGAGLNKRRMPMAAHKHETRDAA